MLHISLRKYGKTSLNMMLTYLYNISGDSLVRAIHRLKLEKVWKDQFKMMWTDQYNIAGDNLVRGRENMYKLNILITEGNYFGRGRLFLFLSRLVPPPPPPSGKLTIAPPYPLS
jgi:hypothetical protein